MEDLDLNKELVQIAYTMKITKPFEIQKVCIPLIKQRKNILATAPTGQGKTAAFVLPMIDHYMSNPHPMYALIITVTYELVMQVMHQISLLSSITDAQVICIHGEESLLEQKNKFSNFPSFIVATPGRLVQLLNDPEIARKFNFCEMIILDECDKLFEHPIKYDVNKILSIIPANAQRICLSSTLNLTDNDIDVIFNKKPYEKVSVIKTAANVKNYKLSLISQIPVYHILHFLLSQDDKNFGPKTKGIIFSKSIRETEIIYKFLNYFNIKSLTLNSLLLPATRKNNLKLFKTDKVRILVSTDIASRGIDIPLVNWVINLNIPKSLSDFINRIGRCGRADGSGYTLTFLCKSLIGKDADKDINSNRIKKIEEYLGSELEEFKIDISEAMINPNKVNKYIAKAKIELEETGLSDKLAIKSRIRKAERIE